VLTCGNRNARHVDRIVCGPRRSCQAAELGFPCSGDVLEAQNDLLALPDAVDEALADASGDHDRTAARNPPYIDVDFETVVWKTAVCPFSFTTTVTF
jgi:hypothetical protein